MNDRISLGGATREGRTITATLTAAHRVGIVRSGVQQLQPRRVGARLSAARVADELRRMRAAQVGWNALAATRTRCEGDWRTNPAEPVIQCMIDFEPSPTERTPAAFRKNMVALGEAAAARFGQREVRVRIGQIQYRVNAPGERGPRPKLPGGKVLR